MEQTLLNCVDLGLDQSFAWMAYVPAETFVESMKKTRLSILLLERKKTVALDLSQWDPGIDVVDIRWCGPRYNIWWTTKQIK